MINVVKNESEDAVIVQVDGEIDLWNCDELIESLSREDVVSASRVLLSLLRCTYMDSTCVSAIINAHRQLPAGLRILVKARTAPAKILRVTGLTDYFTSFESVDEMLDESA